MEKKHSGIIGFLIGTLFGMGILLFGAYKITSNEKENTRKAEHYYLKSEIEHLNNELKLEKKLDEFELLIMKLNHQSEDAISTTRLQMLHEQKSLIFNIKRQISLDHYKTLKQHIFEEDNEEIKRLRKIWPEY